MIIFAIFGFMLLLPQLSEYFTRPIVRLGSRINNGNVLGSFGLGVATGLLWAPCAGPILGLVLTGAAINGVSYNSILLLFAYALGAATSLSIAIFAGGKVFSYMKKSLGFGENIRKVLGVLVIIGVVLIASGADKGFLTQISTANTNKIEQSLIDKTNLNSAKNIDNLNNSSEDQMPSLIGTQWLNSKPLSKEDLKGKVVLIDFWTYSCINCLRTIPYVKAWAEKYGKDGLVVIGIHSPEFAFERDFNNVQKAVKDLGINYPVLLDNDLKNFNAFNNQYWPAHYFIDRNGIIRDHHFGEGDYEESEKNLVKLLEENGHNIKASITKIDTQGIGEQSEFKEVLSPETYIGYERTEGFNSPENISANEAQKYTIGKPVLNKHSLYGTWTINEENAYLNSDKGGITYRFNARDLHLVLGPPQAGQTVKFRVLLDGKPPMENHGLDVDENGYGTIKDNRLYQLIRLKNKAGQHDFSIEFMGKGVSAYAFTFG